MSPSALIADVLLAETIRAEDVTCCKCMALLTHRSIPSTAWPYTYTAGTHVYCAQAGTWLRASYLCNRLVVCHVCQTHGVSRASASCMQPCAGRFCIHAHICLLIPGVQPRIWGWTTHLSCSCMRPCAVTAPSCHFMWAPSLAVASRPLRGLQGTAGGCRAGPPVHLAPACGLVL